MRTWKVVGLALLLVAGVALSTLLLLEHHGQGAGVAAVDRLCGTTDSPCSTVNQSAYAEIRGVSLAALGLFFYLSLLALLFLTTVGGAAVVERGGALALLIVGSALLIDLALIGIQAFSLHAYCKLCFATYALNAGALTLLWPFRKTVRTLWLRTLDPSIRLALGGWLVCSLGLLAAVLAGERALAVRPAVTAAGKPLDRMTLAEARQEVRRLQSVLDDPAQVEEHFNKKALAAYAEAPVQTIDLNDAPKAGAAAAPIQVTVFSDFLCPWCRLLAKGLAAYIPQVSSGVTFAFRHYPLDPSCNPHMQSAGHVGSCLLARGAVCAQEQGRFWPFHDGAFAAERARASRDDVLKLAAEIGLDRARFLSCFEAPQTAARIAREVAQGHALGVSATPTVFVNGKRLERFNDLPLVVQRALAQAGLSGLVPSPEDAGR
jgi:protein-disulfide isomerase/uncharacterized membrane protein